MAKALLTLITILVVITGGAANFIKRSFGPVSMDQIVTHLTFPGILDFNEPDIYRLIAINALIAVAASAVSFAFIHKNQYKAFGATTLAILIITIFQVQGAIKPSIEENCEISIDNLYTSPKDVYITPPSTKPHIVVIFAESLEKSYQDPAVFSKNLTQNLFDIERKNSTYGNFHNVHGTEWTMGGIFGALCSMPLKSVGMLHYNKFQRGSSFYENGVCLPDILRNFGYQNSYFQGTSLRFAGMNKFLRSHSFSEAKGFEELGNKSEGKIYDKDLFETILPSIEAKLSSHTPQLIGISTIDTHPPGTYDERCDQKIEKISSELPGYAELANSYQCLDKNIYDFIQRLKAIKSDRPIHIYISGDHLSMKNPASTQLEKFAEKQNRYIYFSSINGKNLKLDRNFSHFDILPTILGDTGFQWSHESSRLGLGVNLAGKEPSMVEKFGFDKANSILKCQSRLYNGLWLDTRKE